MAYAQKTRTEQRQAELLDAVRAIEPGTLIKSVREAGRDEGRVSIRIGRDIRITIAKRDAERAGIIPGIGWSPELADAVIEAMAADTAKRFALRSLARHAQSRGQIIDKLVRKGTSRAIAQRITDELAATGVINDAALADAAARSMVSRRPAGKRLIESKLRAKRLDGPTATKAAVAALEDRNPLDDALVVARSHARTLPPKLDAWGRERRLLGALARRGFDSDICREAVKRVLGKRSDEDSVDP